MIKATTNRHKLSNLILILLLPPVWWVRQVFDSLRSDFFVKTFSNFFCEILANFLTANKLACQTWSFGRITVLDQSGPIRNELACRKCWQYRKMSKKVTFQFKSILLYCSYSKCEYFNKSFLMQLPFSTQVMALN